MKKFKKIFTFFAVCACMLILYSTAAFAAESEGNDRAVEIEIEIPLSHTVKLNIEQGGAVIVNGKRYNKAANILVDRLKEEKYTIAADSGYKIGAVTYDGNAVTPINGIYTAPKINKDGIVLSVGFEKISGGGSNAGGNSNESYDNNGFWHENNQTSPQISDAVFSAANQNAPSENNPTSSESNPTSFEEKSDLMISEEVIGTNIPNNTEQENGTTAEKTQLQPQDNPIAEDEEISATGNVLLFPWIMTAAGSAGVIAYGCKKLRRKK